MFGWSVYTKLSIGYTHHTPDTRATKTTSTTRPPRLSLFSSSSSRGLGRCTQVMQESCWTWRCKRGAREARCKRGDTSKEQDTRARETTASHANKHHSKKHHSKTLEGSETNLASPAIAAAQLDDQRTDSIASLRCLLQNSQAVAYP